MILTLDCEFRRKYICMGVSVWPFFLNIHSVNFQLCTLLTQYSLVNCIVQKSTTLIFEIKADNDRYRLPYW